MHVTKTPSLSGPRPRGRLLVRVMGYREAYLLLLPALVYLLIFQYGPMAGIVVAFKEYSGRLGIWGSPWVGLENFRYFFRSPNFWPLIRNTLQISVASLVLGSFFPIVLALMINQVRSKGFGKYVQTVTYFPHFISTVVLCGMLIAFLSPTNGMINDLLAVFGVPKRNYLAEPQLFPGIFVASGIWQNCGWNSIIYIAALSSVNPELYEAAQMDGATTLRRTMHIDLPAILPTVVTLFILNTGSIMNVAFEKVYLLQNNLNLQTSEVISTYVYKIGIIQARVGFSTAIGLFNSVINFTLLMFVNWVAKRLGQAGVW